LPPEEPSTAVEIQAVIDVMSGGRLAGIELRFTDTVVPAATLMRAWSSDPVTSPWVTIPDDDTAYIALSSDDDGPVRSTNVAVATEMVDDAIVSILIPRRGHGYEISYPSGNR
jgi:hypothetical protein